jgi:hypothetical protein
MRSVSCLPGLLVACVSSLTSSYGAARGHVADVTSQRTAPGARAAALDETTGRVYLAANGGEKKGPLEILVVSP